MAHRNIFGRAGIFFLVFLLLHFLYDFIPHPVVGIFAATSESVFQHLKIGFYSYMAAGILETRVLRSYLPLVFSRKLYPLLFTATVVPWMLFLLYYVLPALFGEIENMLLHVGYTIGITYIAGLCAAILREEIGKAPLSFAFKAATLILWAATLLITVVFNTAAPPLDLFELP